MTESTVTARSWITADAAVFYCVAFGWPAAGLVLAAYFLWRKQSLRSAICLGLAAVSMLLGLFVL